MDVLHEALEKIRAMELTPSESETHNYKYAFNRCWHLAVDALNAAALSNPESKGELEKENERLFTLKDAEEILKLNEDHGTIETKKLNSEQNPEGCDATEVDSNSIAG